MNDPHVVLLKYKIIENEGFSFNDPPDIDIDSPDFKGRLSNGVLTLEPKDHFGSVVEVRPIFDEFVKSWEIAAGLKFGRPAFHFRFEGSQVIDRQPSPDKQSLQFSGENKPTGTLKTEIISKIYPVPTESFHVTPEVEILWNRYCRFLEDREPLLAMAYSCLTFLESNVGRREAASRYDIEFEVLSKLGDLTANRGDYLTSRKMTHSIKPLTGNETSWINETIKGIITHLATQQSGQILKMSDLPPL